MAKKIQPNDTFTVGRTLSAGDYQHNPPLQTDRSAAVDSAKPKRKSWRKRLILVLLLILIFPITIGIWDGLNYSRASKRIFGSSNLLDAVATTPLKGSDGGRVNILVVGYSADDPGHDGANLTDSIMLISLNTINHTGYMLSIPRDLYVAIPGFGHAKINEAYQDGVADTFNEPDFPPGGIGLLEKTVSQTLGITTHYYALLDYAAVRDITNAVGGVTVNVQSSDPRGVYDPNFKPAEGGPLQLPNGPQKIDGLTALRLTRARGAAGGAYGLNQSDFDRTKNQQVVLTGLKNAIKWSYLLNPTKNNSLLDAAANNIRTDVQISEALPLFKLFRSVPDDQMKSVTLRDLSGQNYLRDYTTPYGQSALIPASGPNNYSSIQAAIVGLNQ